MPDDVAPKGDLALAGARVGREIVWAGRALLRAFSQIVLSEARPTAVLLALAAASRPPSLACGIACALAHPFFNVAAPLTRRHRRRLAELFPIWEVRNGSRAAELNMPAGINEPIRNLL